MIRLRWWAVVFLNNLGDSAAQAIAIGERLLADQERVLGPDHPDTLASRNNLAIAYRAAGRTDEAISLARADPGRPRTRPGPGPPRHPGLAQQPRRRLPGRGPHRRGDHLARADPGRPRTHPGPGPPRHPASRNNLAIAYQAAGRTDEAITLARADPGRPRTRPGPRPPRHPARATTSPSPTRTRAAPTRRSALHEQTLAARERVLGPDHPDTLKSRNNLAIAYQDAGRTDEAISLARADPGRPRTRPGPGPPRHPESRNNLAIAYQDAGRTDEATNYDPRPSDP